MERVADRRSVSRFPGDGFPAEELPGTVPGQRLAPLLSRGARLQPAGVKEGTGVVSVPHRVPRLQRRPGLGGLPHPAVRPGPEAGTLL